MTTTNFKERYTYFDMPELISVLPDFLGKYLMSNEFKDFVNETRSNGGCSDRYMQELKACFDMVDDYCNSRILMTCYTDTQIKNLTIILCMSLHDGFFVTDRATSIHQLRVLLGRINDTLGTKALIEKIENSSAENVAKVDFSNFPKDVTDILFGECFTTEARYLINTLPTDSGNDFDTITGMVHVVCQESQHLATFSNDDTVQLTAYLCHLLVGKNDSQVITVEQHCLKLVRFLDKMLSKSEDEDNTTSDNEPNRVTAGEVDKVIRYLTDTVIATNNGHVKFTPNGLQKLLVMLHEEDVLTHL